MIEVVLCDDHALVRRGIRQTLAEAVDIRVAGEASSYAEVREVLRTTPCDVLLLDIGLPGRGGLEVLSALTESASPIRVLVVSMFAEEQYAIRSLRAGAQGYVSKSGDPHELITATRTVAQGRKYVTPEVAQMLAESVSRPSNDNSAHAALSDRELQTLVKIASGKRLSDIAEELMLSPKTVSVYRSRVLEKLQLPNNAAITVYAIRNNLV
ncbi:response regulator [Variovorax sp. RHLX14]|uniref:response regulator n=1 Tax=Variovorax sp. RHLX14 TaxID=1259731 RepID=UPI003F489C14